MSFGFFIQWSIQIFLFFGYCLTFILGISTLWGWHSLSYIFCIFLIFQIIRERNEIRSDLFKKNYHKYIAIFVLSITYISVVINVISLIKFALPDN